MKDFVHDYFELILLLVIIILFFIGLALVVTPAPVPQTPQIPTKIDVNGIQWNLSMVDDINPGIVGWTECDERRIYIKKTAMNLHATLVHEISHAVVCTDAAHNFQVNNLFFNSTTNENHEGIYDIGEVWSELLTRNPDLAAYLGSKE